MKHHDLGSFRLPRRRETRQLGAPKSTATRALRYAANDIRPPLFFINFDQEKRGLPKKRLRQTIIQRVCDAIIPPIFQIAQFLLDLH
jgi:hypothetical protein